LISKETQEANLSKASDNLTSLFLSMAETKKSLKMLRLVEEVLLVEIAEERVAKAMYRIQQRLKLNRNLLKS